MKVTITPQARAQARQHAIEALNAAIPGVLAAAGWPAGAVAAGVIDAAADAVVGEALDAMLEAALGTSEVTAHVDSVEISGLDVVPAGT